MVGNYSGKHSFKKIFIVPVLSRAQRTVKVLFYENKIKIKYQIVLKKGLLCILLCM